MYEFICPESVQKQSPRTLSDPTMVTQRLAALRSHGSRFWDLGKRLNPRYLPVLENTCPQPTSVKERLSPRLYSPWSKTWKERETNRNDSDHTPPCNENKRTDGRTDGLSAPGGASPATVSRLGVYFLSIPTHLFIRFSWKSHLFTFLPKKCDFAMIAPWSLGFRVRVMEG